MYKLSRIRDIRSFTGLIAINVIMKKVLISLLLFSSILMCYGQSNDSISIDIIQPNIYVVKNEWSQHINFDLSIGNRMLEGINLKRIELYIYDKNDNLINIKVLRDGPSMPSIGMVPVREIKSNENITVFNPFTIFNPYLDLHRLKYILSFKSDSGRSLRVEREVQPEVYIPKSDLLIPLKGTLFVLDGNDLYSNHRRLDINNPLVYDILDMHTNPEMFAIDFSVLDSRGNEYSGDWNDNRDHYIFGKTVYAPAGGKIVKIHNDYEDNKPGSMNFKIQDVKMNKDLLAGNCIIIDHLNGEYSFLVHLKKGSVMVKEGDIVKKGQPIGQVGNSGSSMYPHLHYQLGDNPDYANSNGLPIYFHNYKLISGGEKRKIKKGCINTGDIVEYNE